MNGRKKEFYRSEFLRLMYYVKMSNVCKALDISQSNFSWFLKGRDERLSVDKLEQMYDFIFNEMLSQ